MNDAHHHRVYATVVAAVGGDQLRGEVVWVYRTRRSGACETECNQCYTRWAAGLLPPTLSTSVTLLIGRRCLQRWPTACHRARRYWISALIWYETSCRDISDRRQRDQVDRLLQLCPAGGGHGAGNALAGVATGTEAFKLCVRGRRNGRLLAHRRYLSLPHGGDGQRGRRLPLTPARADLRRHSGQPRRDRSTATEKARPDGRAYFDPDKR